MSARPAGRDQCHMCSDTGERCTAEVLDPIGEVKLCAKHTARVLEYAVWVKTRIARKETTR